MNLYSAVLVYVSEYVIAWDGMTTVVEDEAAYVILCDVDRLLLVECLKDMEFPVIVEACSLYHIDCPQAVSDDSHIGIPGIPLLLFLRLTALTSHERGHELSPSGLISCLLFLVCQRGIERVRQLYCLTSDAEEQLLMLMYLERVAHLVDERCGHLHTMLVEPSCEHLLAFSAYFLLLLIQLGLYFPPCFGCRDEVYPFRRDMLGF